MTYSVHLWGMQFPVYTLEAVLAMKPQVRRCAFTHNVLVALIDVKSLG